MSLERPFVPKSDVKQRFTTTTQWNATSIDISRNKCLGPSVFVIISVSLDQHVLFVYAQVQHPLMGLLDLSRSQKFIRFKFLLIVSSLITPNIVMRPVPDHLLN